MQSKIPLFSDSRGRLSLQGYWGFFRSTDKPMIFRFSPVGAIHESPENDGFIAPQRRTEKIQISFARGTPHPPSPTVPLFPQEKANEIPHRDGVLCMLNRRGRRLDAPKTNEFPHRVGVLSAGKASAAYSRQHLNGSNTQKGQPRVRLPLRVFYVKIRIIRRACPF